MLTNGKSYQFLLLDGESAIGELDGESAAREPMITESAPEYPTKSLHLY